MPAQALMRVLNKAETEKLAIEKQIGDLVNIKEYEDMVLVTAREFSYLEASKKVSAAAAVQTLADADGAAQAALAVYSEIKTS